MSLSRFQILEAPQTLSPNKCVCGAWSGPFIDLGIDIDEGYGVVYLCKDCFVEAAGQLGYHSPEQYKTATIAVEILRTENNKLKDRMEVMENALDSLSALSKLSTVGLSGNAVLDFPQPEQSIKVDDDSESSGEEGSIKQADVEGSTDLFNDDSLNDFLDSI